MVVKGFVVILCLISMMSMMSMIVFDACFLGDVVDKNVDKVVDDVRSWALPLKPRPLGVQQELLNTLYLKTDRDLRQLCEFSLYIALTYSREKNNLSQTNNQDRAAWCYYLLAGWS